MLCCVVAVLTATAQPASNKRVPFTTDTPIVHDPVMAYEDSVYHLYCTGIGIQHMTSKDRRTWTIDPTPVMTVMPQWTHDSVPGFQHHVWAPDVFRWHGRWWLAYSCSTFGKNGSAIGLLSTPSLSAPVWNDEGCIVSSREHRDNWNAIDPCFVIDDNDQPWLAWGSFWDGIQIAPLDTTMHLDNVHRSPFSHHCPPLFAYSTKCPCESYVQVCGHQCHRGSLHLQAWRLVLPLCGVGLLLPRFQEQLPCSGGTFPHGRRSLPRPQWCRHARGWWYALHRGRQEAV